MSGRTDRRGELDLTQSDAAKKAGVSLATWRRWEEYPESVSAKTRAACEDVLDAESRLSRALAESAAAFENVWRDVPYMTPRQAYALSVTIVLWADSDIAEWGTEQNEPLHEVPPFDEFDLSVMMHVSESRAWAEAVRRRAYKVSDEIEQGILPFDRPGPFIDEVLFGAAFEAARDYMADAPDVFDRIAARAKIDDEENDVYLIGDDDWDQVIFDFDERCRWESWEVPLSSGHPLLPALLAERHPYTWFDTGPASTAP